MTRQEALNGLAEVLLGVEQDKPYYVVRCLPHGGYERVKGFSLLIDARRLIEIHLRNAPDNYALECVSPSGGMSQYIH